MKSQKQRQALLSKVLKKASFFEKGKRGPTKGISTAQLAKLLGVTPNAISNWQAGRNGISAKNFKFLQQVEKVIDSASAGKNLAHKVLSKPVSRKVVAHGISKYDSFKYKFLTTGQKYWTNVHAVTI